MFCSPGVMYRVAGSRQQVTGSRRQAATCTVVWRRLTSIQDLIGINIQTLCFLNRRGRDEKRYGDGFLSLTTTYTSNSLAGPTRPGRLLADQGRRGREARSRQVWGRPSPGTVTDESTEQCRARDGKRSVSAEPACQRSGRPRHDRRYSGPRPKAGMPDHVRHDGQSLAEDNQDKNMPRLAKSIIYSLRHYDIDKKTDPGRASFFIDVKQRITAVQRVSCRC